MPKIKSAIKKMRQSEKKGAANREIKYNLKDLSLDFKKKPTPASYSTLSSALDKAAKTNVIHKNKAARLKSRMAKLLKPTTKKKLTS